MRRFRHSLLAATILLLSTGLPARAQSACSGDCDLNGIVSIDEIVRGLQIGLGQRPSSECPNLDRSGDGQVDVADLVAAVDRSLQGCGSTPTPTPTQTPIAPTQTPSGPSCNDCTTPNDPCVLYYGAIGYVVTAGTAFPIQGATVTVDGVGVVSTGADGYFELLGRRQETCQIDYLFTLRANASGYQRKVLSSSLPANRFPFPFPIEQPVGLSPIEPASAK